MSESGDESSEDVSQNATIPIHRMTYEQIRIANIERNNQKLRELFGTDKLTFMSSAVGAGVKSQKGASSQQQQQQVSKDCPPAAATVSIAEAQAILNADFSLLVAAFPGRNVEIRRIWGYLDPDFCPAPALLVHGPSGSGKSDICHSAVLRRKVVHVRVSCDTFSTQKQMIRCLWHEIISVHLNQDKTSTITIGKREKLVEETASAKAPNNFADLVVHLRTLLQSGQSTIAPPFIQRAKLCFVFDNIDKAEELEKGLTFRLLNLTELCHNSIKVIATLPVLQRKPYPCILVSFPAYDKAQIKEILLSKLSNNASADFAKVLNDILDRLTTTTNHIGELYEVICIMNEMNGGGSLELGVSTGRVLTTSSANEFILEQVQMPTLHMNLTGVDQIAISGNKRPRQSFTKFSRLHAVGEVVDIDTLRGRTACVELPLSIKYLIIAVFLASSNSKESDDFIFAMKQKGRRKKEKAGTDTSVSDNSASRSFTLDRLVSIFAQIVCRGGISSLGGGDRAALALGRSAGLPEPSWLADQVEAYYGDARLFAAISDLEAQHLLVRGPGWALERPIYVSAVPLKLANELSRGLSFDLAAFRSQ